VVKAVGAADPGKTVRAADAFGAMKFAKALVPTSTAWGVVELTTSFVSA
jgi:hypothetical protein